MEVRPGHGRMADESPGQNEGTAGKVRDGDAGVRARVRVVVHLGKRKSCGEPAERAAGRSFEGPGGPYRQPGETGRGQEQAGGYLAGSAGRHDDARVSPASDGFATAVRRA